MTEPDRNCWVFVVDTNEYSGNFERELCAYICGAVGECAVGQDFRLLFLDDLSKEEIALFTPQPPTYNDIVIRMPDDHACWRPATIWPKQGTKHDYQGVGIYFANRPTDKMIEIMKERAKDFSEIRAAKKSYYKDNIIIEGFRLIDYKIEVIVKEESFNV